MRQCSIGHFSRFLLRKIRTNYAQGEFLSQFLGFVGGLQILAACFLVAHIAWFVIVAVLSIPHLTTTLDATEVPRTDAQAARTASAAQLDGVKDDILEQLHATRELVERLQSMLQNNRDGGQRNGDLSAATPPSAAGMICPLAEHHRVVCTGTSSSLPPAPQSGCRIWKVCPK